MTKLHTKKGRIHPFMPAMTDHLSLLPVTILSLTAALSPQDKEVLAYLISCFETSTNFSTHPKSALKNRRGGGGNHPPNFHCSCFGCYMSYWVRWDSSPNRELIHQIIDAYEDGLYLNKNVRTKKEKRKRASQLPTITEKPTTVSSESLESDFVEDIVGDEEGELDLEKAGSVRKLVSFIGERIWGVWGIRKFL